VLRPPDDSAAPWEAVEHREEMEHLARLVSQLSQEEQEMLRLRFAAGLTFVNTDVTLRASDGSQVQARESAATMGEGEGSLTFTFPPLPPNVYQVDLDLSAVARSFRLPAGDWRIPLIVYPADSALVANVLSEPYQPNVAPQTHHGITLRLLRVAHTPSQTTLQIQAEFPEEYGSLTASHSLLPRLYDDLGHVYYRPPDGGTQTVVRKEAGIATSPVAKQASPNTRTTTWEDARARVRAGPTADLRGPRSGEGGPHRWVLHSGPGGEPTTGGRVASERVSGRGRGARACRKGRTPRRPGRARVSPRLLRELLGG